MTLRLKLMVSVARLLALVGRSLFDPAAVPA